MKRRNAATATKPVRVMLSNLPALPPRTCDGECRLVLSRLHRVRQPRRRKRLETRIHGQRWPRTDVVVRPRLIEQHAVQSRGDAVFGAIRGQSEGAVLLDLAACAKRGLRRFKDDEPTR